MVSLHTTTGRRQRRPRPQPPALYPFAHACPWQTVYAHAREILDAALVTPAGDVPYYRVDHLGGQCRVRIEPRHSARAVEALEAAFGRLVQADCGHETPLGLAWIDRDDVIICPACRAEFTPAGEGVRGE